MGKLLAVVTRFLLCSLLLALPHTSFAQVYKVKIDPTQGPPGTRVTGTGTDWPYPGDSIQVTWDDGSLTVPKTTVGGSGAFSVPFNVPSNAAAGTHTIRFTASGSQHTPYGLPVDFAVTTATTGTAPKIVRVETFREGDLVFFRLFYTDPDNDAEGFGFRGANGAGWAEETHPFSSPSFGRWSPGQIEYPFNHLCDTGPAYESDVEAWIYDSAGHISPSVTVHLACQLEFQELPVPFETIDYINWYGNTTFAYENQKSIYSELQGLHSGIDFIAPYGTPIKSVVNHRGKVVSINNEPYNYKTGPGNLLIDYGDFLVLYGHTQKSNLPEKIKLDAVIDQNDTIAYVGSDGNLIHLHLEMIRKNPPGSGGRPGDIRTNPVPFFTSTALIQLKQKARGTGATFHPIPGETKWQTPEDQPDITPGGRILVP